tara:strand:- start:2269 stop:3504 length:1236 start_codon:yes stop_codon:yes gene_type:complete
MTSNDPQGVIELGNVNIKFIIFQINNNDLQILSSSIIQSQGIHNGVVINLNKASGAIRSCISAAEKKADVSIQKINVIIEQPEFLCTKFSKSRKIGGAKIDKDDIEFLLKEAKKQVTLNDDKQSIIHIFNHNYIVDGKTFIEEPINVYADHLSHEMTFITMPKNNIKNIKQAFIDCDIEVERFISCTFALGAKLLSDQELQTGSILIDIGFEKTSLALFKNLALVHSITFPIGVNHITKDISQVCSLDLKDSEILKNNIDFSFQNDNKKIFDKNNYLKDIYFKNSAFRKISKDLILDVVQARLDEILKMIKRQIVFTRLDLNFETNFFLTGGGSNLYNLEKYFSVFFNSKAKKINLEDQIDEKNTSNTSFCSCLGAIKIIKDGWETEAIPESVDKHGKKTSFLAKLFGNNS